jgi:ribosomal protein S18 acetylase RimI-like enzyme
MIDKLIIRSYADHDENQVVDLWNLVFPESPAHNNFYDDIDRKRLVQPKLFLLAFVDEKCVGTAMSGFDGHRGWIYYLAVHPDFRRRGIARKLMERVELDLKRVGCTKLNLQVRSNNSEVVEFYQKLGYDVEPRVSMGKLLTRPAE